MNFLSFYSLFFSLTSFASAHFKVLIDLIKGVDEYIEQSNVKRNQSKSERTSESNSIEYNDNEESKMRYESDFSTKDKENSDESDYFINCIKYHQAILE